MPHRSKSSRHPARDKRVGAWQHFRSWWGYPVGVLVFGAALASGALGLISTTLAQVVMRGTLLLVVVGASVRGQLWRQRRTDTDQSRAVNQFAVAFVVGVAVVVVTFSVR